MFVFVPQSALAQEAREAEISIEKTTRSGGWYYSRARGLDFSATALGFSWPAGQGGALEAKIFQDGQWLGWQEAVASPIQHKNDPSRTYSDLVFADAVTKIKLRARNGEFLQHVKIFYMDASVGTGFKPVPTRGGQGMFSIASYSDGLDIITRSEWGANDGYRFRVVEDEEERRELIEKGAEIRGNEIEIWPHEYAGVKKLVMHETDGSPGEDDPVAIVRNLYFYHAVRLGWGDCGYHYVLDTLGNVYECKSGGDGVIGGHVYATEIVTLPDGQRVELGFNMNHGSIGISVLGSYDTDRVTGGTQNALAKLVERLALDFQLDPGGLGSWEVPVSNRSTASQADFKAAILASGRLCRIKGIECGANVSDMEDPRIVMQDFLNFVGHGDIDYKSDPQKNLRPVFESARNIASQSYQKKMREGYLTFAGTIVSQSATELKLSEGQSASFVVRARNDGNTAWHGYGDRRVVLSSASGEQSLDVPNVEPGETASFSFSLAPDPRRAQKTHTYELAMLGEDSFSKKKIEVVVINKDLSQADYATEFQGHNFPPAFFDNATPTLKLSYLNVGKLPWKQGEMILNVTENMNETRHSPWQNENWPSTLGKFTFLEEEVAPEGVATFEIPFGNLSPGIFNHRFYITRLIPRDGLAPGEEKVIGSGSEIYNRVDPIFGAELVSHDIPPAVLTGWNVPVEFTFKNVGLSPWKGTLRMANLYKPDDVALSFIDYGWQSSSIISSRYVNLAPGEEATFKFKIDCPRAPGQYDFAYKLVLGNRDIWVGGAKEQKIAVRVD